MRETFEHTGLSQNFGRPRIATAHADTTVSIASDQSCPTPMLVLIAAAAAAETKAAVAAASSTVLDS
jgi:hypothetical protein